MYCAKFIQATIWTKSFIAGSHLQLIRPTGYSTEQDSFGCWIILIDTSATQTISYRLLTIFEITGISDEAEKDLLQVACFLRAGGTPAFPGVIMWEHFHHQADIGIRGIGQTLEEAFAEGAVALMAVICSPDTVPPTECVEIQVEAEEKDLLFADWINALIYEMDVRKMLFSRFEVTLENHRLTAKVWGEKADPDRHEFAVEVKAATFMELKAYKDNDGQWVVQCVVDV